MLVQFAFIVRLGVAGSGSFVDGVVGLVAKSCVEWRMQGGGGGGVEFEIVLEWVGGIGIVVGDYGTVGGARSLHGRGEPAFAVVDVAIPQDGVGHGGGRADGEREVAAGVEGIGRGVLCGDGRAWRGRGDE